MRVVNKWTDAEEKKLKKLAQEYSSREITQILNRSYNSVAGKLRELNIKPIQKMCRYGTFEDIQYKYLDIQEDLYARKYTYQDLENKYGYCYSRLKTIIYDILDWEDNGDVPVLPIRKKRVNKKVQQWIEKN